MKNLSQSDLEADLLSLSPLLRKLPQLLAVAMLPSLASRRREDAPRKRQLPKSVLVPYLSHLAMNRLFIMKFSVGFLS